MPVPNVTIREIDQSSFVLSRGSVIAVVGPAMKGPFFEALLCRSEAELQYNYGTELTGHPALAIARQIIQGGGVVRFQRVSHATDIDDPSTLTAVAASVTLKDRAAVTPLDTVKITAKWTGTWANGTTVTITAPTDAVATHFKLSIGAVSDCGIEAEVYDNIGIADLASIVSPHWTIESLGSLTVSPGNIPALISTTLASGTDGTGSIAAADYVGSVLAATGIFSLGGSLDFIDLIIPGLVTNSNQRDVVSWCEENGVLYHISTPTGLTDAEMVQYRDCTGVYTGTKINSSYASFLFGDLEYRDKLDLTGGTSMYEGLGGFGAVLAYSDTVRTASDQEPGPWLSPYGVQRGKTRAYSVHQDISKSSAKIASFKAAGINWFEIRNGAVIARGNRTALVTAGAIKWTQYVHVRRNLLSFRKQLEEIGQGFIDEPHDTKLWRKAYRQVNDLATYYRRKGAFSRVSVECDQKAKNVDEAVLNTASVRAAGLFKMRIEAVPIGAVDGVYIDLLVGESAATTNEE